VQQARQLRGAAAQPPPQGALAVRQQQLRDVRQPAQQPGGAPPADVPCHRASTPWTNQSLGWPQTMQPNGKNSVHPSSGREPSPPRLPRWNSSGSSFP
jgi:hypothetical protein